jgi:polysaccharide chain length determinant protein (PEP-CTERM system associated)
MPSFGQVSMEHYLRVLVHRWWLIVLTFLVCTMITFIVVSRLPDIYMSETLILVDPQKVPDSYVRATVSGDVRNRLNTLEQQILSSTRLQKIIDSLKLYTEERRTMAREEIIAKMRKDITISMVADFSRQESTLQAFKISYSGRQPTLVARVVSELAGLFIEENLKAREQQAMGTTEFLESQLVDTRKALEAQEAKLRDFRLKHIGEMPEQEAADLQILGQLQSQMHLTGEALARAEQQRNMAQAMMSQSVPVVDYDDGEVKGVGASSEDHGSKSLSVPTAPAISPKAKLVAELNDKLKRGYTERHPDIRRLKAHIAEEEAKEPKPLEPQQAELKVPAPPDTPKETATTAPVDTAPARRPAASTTNPVLITQLKSLDADIAKQKEEQQRLNKQITVYQSKLEAIPVRQQEVSELVRDYEISKAHYSQLLDKQLSAETATQLEIRQKGEKFSILDPAQPAEKPSKPNRKLFDAMGALAGLVLGVLLALASELTGTTITTPDQVALSSGVPVLEVIPVIVTTLDHRRRKKRMLLATVSSTVVTLLVCSAVLYYRYRG